MPAGVTAKNAGIDKETASNKEAVKEAGSNKDAIPTYTITIEKFRKRLRGRLLKLDSAETMEVPSSYLSILKEANPMFYPFNDFNLL